MSALTIGIDPGQSGGIAILDSDGTLESVADLPVIRDGRLAWIDGGRLPIELVTPAVWKATLRLSKDKAASLDKARLLYRAADIPLAKHEGRAEAILIAHYGFTRRLSAETGAA